MELITWFIDLILHLEGSGTTKLLLLGHLDTVVSHNGHRPVERTGDRLIGSGTEAPRLDAAT